MHFIATLPEWATDVATRAVWTTFEAEVGAIDGLAFYRHPALTRSRGNAPDLTIVTNQYQPIVIRVAPWAADDIEDASEDIDWRVDGNNRENPLLDVKDIAVELEKGADLLQPRKPDRFRAVGGAGSIRIDRLRVACMA